MAHLTVKSSYKNLVERINRFPQGATPSELLYKILQMLFSETEAEYVALLPIKPFTAKIAAKNWKKSLQESQQLLENLASRGLLVDVERNGESFYTLPPPMAGFFEFSMMRVRNDIDQKVLSELFYQYITQEEDFIKALFTEGETQLGRVFVHEPALPTGPGSNDLHVLDYERASQVIETASCIGVGLCYCRHKMEHLGRACDAPQDICMTFNSVAESLTKHGVARQIDAGECLDLLQSAYEHNLVQFGENIREGVNFICNCCGCCCEALIAARRFAILNPVHTTNYLPTIANNSCTGCGRCVDICPVEALSLVSANDPSSPKKRTARLDESICLGCGVCVRNCPQNCISLKQRNERVITPLNSAHKAVLQAIERGKLQHLIVDKQAFLNHRIMATILGVILKLPPVKQILASKQMKSRYLEKLLSRYE